MMMEGGRPLSPEEVEQRFAERFGNVPLRCSKTYRYDTNSLVGGRNRAGLHRFVKRLALRHGLVRSTLIEIARVREEVLQIEVAERVVRDQLTVRAVRALVKLVAGWPAARRGGVRSVRFVGRGRKVRAVLERDRATVTTAP